MFSTRRFGKVSIIPISVRVMTSYLLLGTYLTLFLPIQQPQDTVPSTTDGRHGPPNIMFRFSWLFLPTCLSCTYSFGDVSQRSLPSVVCCLQSRVDLPHCMQKITHRPSLGKESSRTFSIMLLAYQESRKEPITVTQLEQLVTC